MSEDHASSPLRKRILMAARQSFSQRGFAETSVRELAAMAKTTKPMVYYYFGSKTGLHEAVLEEARARATFGLAEIVTSSAPPDEKLLALVRHVQTCEQEEPHALYLLARARQELGATVSTSSPLHEAYAEVLSAVLHEGENRGLFRPVDPALFTHFFVALMPLFRAESPPAAEAITDLLLRGVSISQTVVG